MRPFIDIGHSSYQDELLYLPYDPSVQFSSTFFISYSIWMLFSGRFLLSLVTFPCGFVSFLANFIVSQRTPTFLTISFTCIFVLVLLRQYFRKYFLLFAFIISIFLIICIVTPSSISSIFDFNNFSVFTNLLEKQEKFGINAKDQELYTVFKAVFSNFFRTLFGIGWGSVFNDPIVPGEEISYTHSGLSYFLLKTGLLGLLFFVLYIFYIFKSLLYSSSLYFSNHNLSKDNYRFHISFKILVFLSSLSPILIGLLFQPSYKTLSFGVVLLSLLLFY
jgi:hypothetical protein